LEAAAGARTRMTKRISPADATQSVIDEVSKAHLA
jgi:hypothetical protein